MDGGNVQFLELGDPDAEDQDEAAAQQKFEETASKIADDIEALDAASWEAIGKALTGFIGELDKLAQEQVTKKILIEQRWLEDLRQYHGRYSAETEQRLRDADRSMVFANLTRPKTHAWAARLGDMLFPVDDRNWACQPTPDPKLVDQMQFHAGQARRLVKRANHHLSLAAHKYGIADQLNGSTSLSSPGASPPAPASAGADAGAPAPSEMAGEPPPPSMPTDAPPGGAPPPPMAAPPNQGAPGPAAAASPSVPPNAAPGLPLNVAGGGQPLDQQAQGHEDQAQKLATIAAQHHEYAALANATMEEAKDKADAMQDQIDGQLTRGKWNIKNRTAILDMCKLGTCVLKGPITRLDTRGAWRMKGKNYVLENIDDPQPEPQRVDPWNWFPDMSARNAEEKEFDFERHLYTRRQLQKLAKRRGFNKDAIKRILMTHPPDSPPTYLTLLREVTGNPNIAVDKRYIIWEYHGSIEVKDIKRLAVALLPPKQAANVIASMADDDPLLEKDCIIWFGHNEVIKFGPHPLDSGASLFDSTNFVEDDSSLFGYGVPYIMRNSQSVINGAWRMMMDNGGISAGPQVVVNTNVLEPANGSMNIHGMKVWQYQQGKTLPPQSLPPFQVFQIQNNQPELINLVKLAMEFIDIEISLPLVAQGEAGAHPETANGRALLMNSANVIFRWVVKNWDDWITTPMIEKFYDWNMQHSDNDYIKGDFKIEARGSSVLLVRDMQAQNLAAILGDYSGHPVLGPLTKAASAYRKLVQCYGINPDDIVKTEDELEQDAEKQAQAPQQQDANAIRLQIAQLQDDTKRMGFGISRDTALSVIAAKQNMTLDQLKAKLDINDASMAHKERLFAAELAQNFRIDAADRQDTLRKETMIAARTGHARGMPKDVHAAATDYGNTMRTEVKPTSGGP